MDKEGNGRGVFRFDYDVRWALRVEEKKKHR